MYCVVLDLDRTLIHTSTARDERFETFPVLDSTLWAHVRPHAATLLKSLSTLTNVEVCIWTAAVPRYAEDVVDGLCQISAIDRKTVHVLSRDDATRMTLDGTTVYVKDLRLVQQRIPRVKDVVLVDDDPVHQRVLFNQGRVVQIPPFLCDPNDNVLSFVILQMNILSRVANSRMHDASSART